MSLQQPNAALCALAHYFELIAYVSLIVNWNELRRAGGVDTGGSLEIRVQRPDRGPEVFIRREWRRAGFRGRKLP